MKTLKSAIIYFTFQNVKVMPRDPDCGYFKSFDRKKYFSISLGLLWTGYEQIHQLFESNSLKILENKVLL